MEIQLKQSDLLSPDLFDPAKFFVWLGRSRDHQIRPRGVNIRCPLVTLKYVGIHFIRESIFVVYIIYMRQFKIRRMFYF